jgi:hypothetical protein
MMPTYFVLFYFELVLKETSRNQRNEVTEQCMTSLRSIEHVSGSLLYHILRGQFADHVQNS